MAAGSGADAPSGRGWRAARQTGTGRIPALPDVVVRVRAERCAALEAGRALVSASCEPARPHERRSIRHTKGACQRTCPGTATHAGEARRHG